MMLSVLVPVYNEEKTIGSVLKKISVLNLGCNYEIIVINDGSTDNTLKELEKLNIKKLKIVRKSGNSGKGAAIISGISRAKGDYVLIQDADLEYNPEEISRLLAPVINNRNNPGLKIAIYGSRFQTKRVEIPLVYYFGNKFLTVLTNLLFGIKLTDMETGYKLIPSDFLKKNKLKSRRFDIEPEITAKLCRNGIKIIEIPISYHGRSHTAGKKLTIRDSIGAIRALLYYRFYN